MKEFVSSNELKDMVEKAGLILIEDFMMSITNGKKSAVVNEVGCLQEPPYSTLYSKKQVEMVISKLK